MGPLLGPKLAPCWKPWSVLGRSWASLERSWVDRGPIFDHLGTACQDKRLQDGWLCEKPSKTLCFSMVFEGPKGSMSPTRPKIETCLSMGTGSAMNLKVISRSCSDHAPNLLQTCFNQLTICSDHAPNILQTCFNQLTIAFRSIATLFRYVSYHISDEFPRCHKQVYLRKAHKH